MSARPESAPFEALRERLLRAGIAPRHVRRYLRELTDHLADLTERQRAAGYDEENAAIRARALLGDDAELAVAMEEQPGFRSITVRFPWAVFLLAPPFIVTLGFLLWATAMVLIGFAGGVIPAHHKIPLPVPAWYAGTASALMFCANFLIPCLLGFLLVWIAERRRMRMVWPLLAMALILAFGVHGDFHANTENISIGLGTILPLHGPFGPGGISDWPTFLGQAALLGLPAMWLLWTQRKVAA